MVHVHDAIVVGAGPGGSAAGHLLSAHGLDVLLLDRAEFPRDKTCGDGLTPRALRALDHMGVLSLAVDPHDADRLYAACGLYLDPGQQEGALLASSDRGATGTV